MAETEGMMLTCDLCGETVFLKYLETKDYDGGFTHVRHYEDVPEGWGSIHFGSIVFGTLCPSCYQRMQDALLDCIGKIKEQNQ